MGTTTVIIETSDNRFYRVTETNQAGLDHVWLGTQVKRTAKGWAVPAAVLKRKPHRQQELVRKAATRVVQP
jgi:hypothetical protein